MLCYTFALFRLQLLDIMPMAYETILNNVPDGLIVLDTKERIVALNRYVQRYVEYASNPIGKTVEMAFTRYSSQLAVLRASDEPNHQFQLDNRVIEVRRSPVLDQMKRQRGYLIILRDVTARAQVEQVQHDERLFSETIRNIGNTLNSTLDTDRVLSLIIESIGELVTHSHCNIMIIEPDGYSMRVRQHRGYTPQAAAMLESLVFDYRDFPKYRQVAGASDPVIIADTHSDPEWIIVAGGEDVRSFACAPIQVDDSLVGFINVDGSVPGALKPQVARQLQVLAQQAAIAIKNARLYGLINQQAEELKKYAIELENLYARVSQLEQLKSDMIRVASHDLRNPLGLILAYVSFLITDEYGPPPVPAEEVPEKIREAALRMRSIVENFLSLERIAQIAQQQTMTTFDLQESALKAVDEFANRAAEKRQQLKVDMPANPCVVYADPIQLYEAITNFVSNAVKYTPEDGQITVRVALNETKVRLEVQDTGFGIPRDQQNNLFEPFYRAKTEETRDIEGIGLGLHVSKNIIERNGGRLIFQSIYRQGSTFGFEMSLYRAATLENIATPQVENVQGSI
jgi:PAS domain S-box-containing protein